MQGLLARFASQAGLWQRAVKGMAELDALMALGYAAQFGGEGAPMCRPTFIEPQKPSFGQPAGHVSTLLTSCLSCPCCNNRAAFLTIWLRLSAQYLETTSPTLSRLLHNGKVHTLCAPNSFFRRMCWCSPLVLQPLPETHISVLYNSGIYRPCRLGVYRVYML